MGDTKFGTSRVKRALASVSLAALAIATLSGVAHAEPRQFNLASDDAVEAIPEFGRQAGVQIVAPARHLRGLQTQAVQGVMEPREALGLLLAGTGLEVATDDGRVITLRREGEGDSADPMQGDAAEASPQDQADLVVTGTRIRGVRNETAPIVRVDREAIENSGYSTTQDLFESIPQIFGGGPAGASEDGLAGEGNARNTNFTAASGVNLRGLGPNATLVLLNGRRMAPSQFGQTVDVSLLPLNALGGVDVLTDGASALYGSDAVAGVVNVTVRGDLNGAETLLRYGDSADGGRSERTIAQAYGKDWRSGALFAALQYQDLEALGSGERAATSNKPEPSDILPETTTYSGVFTLDQSLTERVDLFAQGFYATKDIVRDMRNGGYQETYAGDTENISLTVGATIDLVADWRATASINYGQDTGDMAQDQLLLAGSTLTTFAQTNTFESVGAEIVLDGALVELPAGPLRAAFGAAYRNDEFHQVALINGAPALNRRAGSEVSAVFAEFYVPLVSPQMGVAGVHTLDVSLAGRYDHYDIFGETTNPRIGVVYAPIEGFRVRASLSNSFRAPNPAEQFYGTLQSYIFGDPMGDPAGPGTIPGFILQGSLPLGPETAESFNWGFDWTPDFLPGFAVTLNRYDIAYEDRIVFPGYNANALRNPAVYGSLIGTFANDAEAQAFLDARIADGFIFDDWSGVGSTGVRYYYDGRQRNAASLNQSGVDLTITQSFELDRGDLMLRFNASYIDEIDTMLVEGAQSLDYVSTYGYPVDLRWRADATWTNEAFTLNAGLNFVDEYDDTTLLTPQTIKSWTTVDLNARVRLGALLGDVYDGVQLGLSAQNLFDEDPPFVVAHQATSVNYDPSNASPLGRFVAADLRVRW